MARAVGAGAGRRLEIVDELLHDATFHEARRARRHTLIVQTTGRGAADHQRIVGEREAAVEHLLADARGQRRDALQHRLAGERLSDGEHERGEAERREDHRQRPFRGSHDTERVLESQVDRADQGGEGVVGGQVGPFVGVADRQHVVARDTPQLGAHPDRGRAIRPGGAGRVRDPRFGGFTLDRDVDPTPLALELLEQRAPDSDQVVQGRVGRTVEKGGHSRQRCLRRKRQVQLFAQRRGREGAIQ